MNNTTETTLRKEIRKSARLSLRKHYWIFVVAALVAAILGTEYANTTQIFRIQRRIRTEQTQPVQEIQPAMGAGGSADGSVFNDLINGDWQGTIDAVGYRLEVLQGKETYVGDVQLGHSRGVLASIVNEFESGSLLLSLLTMIDTILGSKKLAVIVLAILGFAIMLLFWLLVSNVYRAVCCRLFLEGRIYEKIPASRFMFLYRVKKHTKAALSMALYTFLKYLWLLTIVGYPIKRYSYLLVPYLVAENPDLSAREAIRLSSRMMKGHKWEAFLLELTLIPWMLLSIATGGLVGILFYNPYREAVFAEYSSRVRCQAKEQEMEGTDRLNDRYLFEVPSEADLRSAYQDVVQKMADGQDGIQERGGVWGWLESWFGLVPSLDEKEQEYRTHMQADLKKEEYLNALEGKTYPTRLYPIKEVHKRKRTDNLGYMRHYSIPAVILLFFVFCMFGWLWEVTLHLLQTGEFANRGVLHGPWLPIYGSGVILILTVLYRLRRKPIVEFIAIIILCGIVEYLTSWVLEVLHDGAKWWDYTGYYLNLNGRICAEGLLVFGIGGMAFVYVLAPVVDNIIEQIRMKILVPVCAALLVVFGVDVVYSGFHPNQGKGVTESIEAESGAVTAESEQG